jgi:WD40 repeat protein
MDCKLVSGISTLTFQTATNYPSNSSKDTKIRVWNRETLELYRTLSGHEGPVNAIGLQRGLVVSASGDTKMMLWDIERGTCLRTFDGHDRGLACIEFKVHLFLLRRIFKPADMLTVGGNRTISLFPARVTARSRCGTRIQANAYARLLDTTHSSVLSHLTLLRDALSAQATTR